MGLFLDDDEEEDAAMPTRWLRARAPAGGVLGADDGSDGCGDGGGFFLRLLPWWWWWSCRRLSVRWSPVPALVAVEPDEGSSRVARAISSEISAVTT
jgi:hypothetical protein